MIHMLINKIKEYIHIFYKIYLTTEKKLKNKWDK